VPQFRAGRASHDADVVVRAGVDAVEAEGAVQVAGLPRQVEAQLAAVHCSLSPGGRGRGEGATSNAVLRGAGRTDGGVAHLHLQRRAERLHEVELTDGADVLAERGAAEDGVDGERSREEAQRDPGGPPRAVPERERLVGPEEEQQERHRRPLVPQYSRPGPALRQPAPGQRPGRQERAAHAEEVPRRQQPQHHQPPPVNPRQDPRQVHRPHLRPTQPVIDHQPCQQQQRHLQRQPGVSPSQKTAQQRNPQYIEE